MNLDREEPQEGRFYKKMKENPFFPIGIFGLVTACGIGAYKFKDRGAMSTSVYLMQLRVTAQSAVIGTLAFGLMYHMVRHHLLKLD